VIAAPAGRRSARPNKTLAAQLCSEFREFFRTIRSGVFVSLLDYYQPEAYVPSRDLYIEKDSSINEHIEQMRALGDQVDPRSPRLRRRRDGVGDLRYRRSVRYCNSMILHLRQGDKLTQRDAIKRLTEMQYQRNETGIQRGTFRVHRRRARHLPRRARRQRDSPIALRRRGGVTQV
jgi:excinuclease ABC subunit B